MKNIFKALSGFIPAFAIILTMTAGCDNSSGGGPGDGSSQGGSMARFTINGDFLYTVDNNYLSIVSLADPAKPVVSDEIFVGSSIETIFTMDDLLFMGSQTGMYIYDISRPEFPEELSITTHFRSCDPVVACGDYAFVTLNSSLGTWCGNAGNALVVYDISDLENPVKIDETTLSSPRGLAVDEDEGLLFVCDNAVKVFDISDPTDVQGLYTSASVPDMGRINAYDCIVTNGKLLIVGSDGLYQASYDRATMSLISKIAVN